MPPKSPARVSPRRVSNLTLDLKLHSLRTVDPRARAAAGTVRQMVADGRVSPFEAIAVLRAIAAEVARDPTLADDVVVELAKGRQGLAGALDNVLPAATVCQLLSLLRCGVLPDVVALLIPPPRRPWWRRLLTGSKL